MDLWTELLRHNWTPNGDTTVAGSITIIFYAITSLLCLLAAYVNSGQPSSQLPRQKTVPHKSNRIGSKESPYGVVQRDAGQFWLYSSLLLLFLTLHKHFNWFVGITNFIRNRAYYNAWYSSRQVIQGQVLWGGLLLVLLLFTFLVWRLRYATIAHCVAATGLLFLSSYVVVRAVSSHTVDAIIYRDIISGGIITNGAGVFTLNRVLEFGGILVVFIAATWALQTYHKAQNSNPS